MFNHDVMAQMNCDWQLLKKFGNSKAKQICAQHSKKACLEVKNEIPFKLKRYISCFALPSLFLV